MDDRLVELTQFKIDERAPGYWRIVYANPPINLLNSTTVLEIGEVVTRIEEAEGLRVVVFASDNPDFFMARYDLADPNPIAFAPTDTGVTRFIDATQRLARASAISIASIRGRARGGGSEFALACDLRFASLENTVLGQPEVGVGILPAGGGLERLTTLVGVARALEIIASSDDYDATTAEAYGWINRAIPDFELDLFVDALARRLALFNPEPLAWAKRLIQRHASISTDDFKETLAALRPLLTSPATAARRGALIQQAAYAGKDFELSMGRHLGLAGAE